MNPASQDSRDDLPPHEAAADLHAPADPQEFAALPTAVPRPLSAMARRRAWSEPRARFWVLASLVLTIIAVYFLVNSMRARSHEAWLIAHGFPIVATIRTANEESVPHRLQAPDSTVLLRFSWHGADYDAGVAKLPGRKERIETGSLLHIRVNPNNPEDWTWLNEPLPLLTRAIGALITLPIAALALAWALLHRIRLLRTWRHGEAVRALIVAMRPTAVAPRSRAADVTPYDDNERRIFTVYLPPHCADMELGDGLYIIRRSARSSWAIAARWFE